MGPRESAPGGSGGSSAPGSGGSGVLAAGSRIMGLKFMQRRHAKPGQSTAAAAPAAEVASAQHASSNNARSETEWTLPRAEAAASAPSAPRVVLDDDCDQPSPTAALIQFRAGRRSFGSFNPRLEKRLSEIQVNQRAARDELAEAERAEEDARRRREEHAALVARAEADEAIERQNAVSDAELASHFSAKYGKYVPPPRSAPSVAAAQPAPVSMQPPVVDRPVQVSDAPLHAGKVHARPHHSGDGHGDHRAKKPRR